MSKNTNIKLSLGTNKKSFQNIQGIRLHSRAGSLYCHLGFMFHTNVFSEV